jgi:chemotaxis methyl-accepting protein methylase
VSASLPATSGSVAATDGVASPDDPAGFAALVEKIAGASSFACASYKEKCLRRRIGVRMRARGVHSYADYMRVLDRDPGEYGPLVDALTINVTKLFRNWEVYDAVARQVVPELWARREEPLRVWSAGCSSGEEVYSLAALFHRHAESRAEAVGPARLRVLGTDIDRASLAAAGVAAYEEGAFADAPAELRARYFTPTLPARVVPELRAVAAFEHRDLLRQDPPAGGHHLIACRNVVIYFDRTTQEALFERFHAALVPGGFLVLGKVETLLGAARALFAPVSARERIFRRL